MTTSDGACSIDFRTSNSAFPCGRSVWIGQVVRARTMIAPPTFPTHRTGRESRGFPPLIGYLQTASAGYDNKAQVGEGCGCKRSAHAGDERGLCSMMRGWIKLIRVEMVPTVTITADRRVYSAFKRGPKNREKLVEKQQPFRNIARSSFTPMVIQLSVTVYSCY